MASKAVGFENGVCRNADLVVVKTTLYNSDIAWVFNAILEDIRTNARSQPFQPSVVIFPINSFANPNPGGYPWVDARGYIEQVFQEDVPIVVDAGNRRSGTERQAIDTLPAMWAEDSFPLIVAGSVNNEGVESPFSQGPEHVSIWAPGQPVTCAKRNGVRPAVGTSYSTGIVSRFRSCYK